MDWRERAAISPYQTAVAIEHELKSGHLEEASAGIQELIDALSRSEKRALKAQLIRLMVHVIKWKTQPDRRSRGWSTSVLNAREEIADIQEETPSLNDAVIQALWAKSFAAAKRQAEDEMNQECPLPTLTRDQVFLDEYGNP